jgi:hypothetical protein
MTLIEVIQKNLATIQQGKLFENNLLLPRSGLFLLIALRF